MFYFIILIRQFSQSEPRAIWFASFFAVSTRSLSLVHPTLSICRFGGGTPNEHDYRVLSFIVPRLRARARLPPNHQNTIQ